MFRGYRHIVLALGLIAISSAVLGQTDEQPQEPQRKTQQEQGPTQIAPIPLPIEIVEDEATAEARKRHEAEASEREIKDLIAQQGMNTATQAMNRATERMAEYAFWSTIIVAFGTGLVFASLILMWGANRAAVTAVNVIREMAQRELRAYVNFTFIEVISDVDQMREDQPRNVRGYQLKVTVENAGATPAVDCNVYGDHCFVDAENFHTPVFNQTKDGGGQASIGPHSKVYGPPRYISRDDAQRVLEKKARLFVWWRAEYRDVFNRSPDRFVEKSWEVLIPTNPEVLKPGDPLPSFRFIAFGRQTLN